MDAEQIIAIIKRRLAECDEANAKFYELEASSHIPQATLDRKRYATDAMKETLQVILDEIEPVDSGEYWIVDHPLLHE